MTTQDIQVYTTENTRVLKADCFDFYAKQLPPEERARINRYKRPEDRQAALLGKALLIAALENTGLDWMQLQRNDYGKPFLMAAADQPHFNISHSGNYVVAALSRHDRIGVDIEKIRPLDINGFRQFFSEAEWQTIQKSRNALEQFFIYWSIKEAVIKAAGKGLSVSLSEVFVSGNGVKIDGQIYQFREIPFHEAYRLTVAAPGLSDSTIILSDYTHHFDWE